MLKIESHLRMVVEKNEEYLPFLLSYEDTKRKMKLYLPSIMTTFPFFSEHDSAHSQNILSAIESILGSGRVEELTAADSWLLLMSAYLHDIGMLITFDEQKNEWESQNFKDFLETCKNCSDIELSEAALRVSPNFTINTSESPVQIKQDVILLLATYYRSKHASRSLSIIDNKSSIS